MATRRLKEPIPPSADVAERTLADVIGQGVALHLAEVVGPLLERLATLQLRPACLVCAMKAKRAERDYEIAVANARAAAEPEPEAPGVTATESFTEGSRGPVCWAHFDPDEDGFHDLDDYLPPPVD